MSANLDALLTVLESHPEDWQIRTMVLDGLLQDGKVSEAVGLLRSAPSAPDESTLDSLVSKLYASNPSEAYSYVDGLVANDFKNGYAHLWKAKLAAALGQKTEATKHYKLAQAMRPGTSDADLEATLAGPAPVAAPPAQDPLKPASGAVKVSAMRPPVEEEDEAPPAYAAAAMAVTDDDDEPVLAATPVVPVAMVPPVAMAVPVTAAALPTPPSIAAPTSNPVEHEAPVGEEQGEYPEQQQWAEGEEPPGWQVGENVVEYHPEVPIAQAKKKENDTKETAAAVTIALLIHAAVLLLLGILAITLQSPPPPEITAVIAPMQPESTEVTKKTVVQPKTTKTTPVESPAVNLLTTTVSAPVTVPAIPTTNVTDVVDLGTSLTSTVNFGGGSGGMAGVPIAMKSRCSPSERIKMLREHGGSVKIEDAVRTTLIWLKSQQKPDGSWGDSDQAAMTGFALLCYLGRCETADSPEFGDTVYKGIMYLVDLGKKNNGLLSASGNRNHVPYEHGIAAYGLGETYALAKYGKRELPGVREGFEKAVEIIIDSQTKRGSWAYGYDKNLGGDLSVTGWNYQALKAAKHTNLKFGQLGSTINATKDYIESINGPKGGFGYAGPDDKLSLTSAGVLGLQMLGAGNRSKINGGLKFVREHYEKNSPSDTASNLYEWYYNTQAFFNQGGEDWQWWNGIFQNRILGMQNADGSFKAGLEGHGANPVYNTALCTLMLEVYYRYLPASMGK